jgi:hypothetical protein
MNERDERLIRDVLTADRSDRFAAGFADRTVARWRAHETASFDIIALAQFRRLAPIGVAAALLLGVLNVRHREPGQTVIAALLGASSAPVTLDSIYGLESLVGGR